MDTWLTERRTTARRRISDGTAESYRSDLSIWARILADVLGVPEAPGDVISATSPDPELTRMLRHERQDRQLQRIGIEDLTEANLRAALAVMDRTTSAATQERRLAALSNLCAWLVRRHILGEDPTEELGTPKTSGKLPVGMTDAEVQRAFAAAESPRGKLTGAWPVRDAAIVRVLAGTGIRNAELTGLLVGSINRDQEPNLLRVQGKGNKIRVVPIPGSAVKRVDAYLDDRRNRHGLGGHILSDILFVRNDGRPFDRASLDRLVTRIFATAGVSEIAGEKAHRFRHAYAKRMLASGLSVTQVQALLGHESLQTTGIYTRLAAIDVLDAALVAHGAEDV